MEKSEKTAAIYSLWFGLDYGSILTAYSLYEMAKQEGVRPYLLRKLPKLWTDHYDEKDNIAGKFIYGSCDVLDIFDNAADKKIFDGIDNCIVGSDVVWNDSVVGQQAGFHFFCEDAPEKANKFAFGSSFGNDFPLTENALNKHAMLLRKFSGISVKDIQDTDIFGRAFGFSPDFVIDPVFLCSKQRFVEKANEAPARGVEGGRFIWSYVKNGDSRKKEFLLRGNNILMEKYTCPLRNFIDINRYPESKKALGLEPAFHILVNDWLYYLINSEFVITDDYYGMCFAMIFEKPFVVMVQKDMPDLSRYYSLLNPIGLEERLVFMTDDFREKEYLFRKPVRYDRVNKKLSELSAYSSQWFRSRLYAGKENE